MPGTGRYGNGGHTPDGQPPSGYLLPFQHLDSKGRRPKPQYAFELIAITVEFIIGCHAFLSLLSDGVEALLETSLLILSCHSSLLNIDSKSFRSQEGC